MELAIPIVAIGGLYIACNQDNQENFTNNELPNTNVKDKNYPFNIEENEEELTSKLATVNKYQPNKAYTDKYFSGDNKLASQTMNMGGEEFYSLTYQRRMAMAILQDYLIDFKGDPVKAIVAYNAGYDRAKYLGPTNDFNDFKQKTYQDN